MDGWTDREGEGGMEEWQEGRGRDGGLDGWMNGGLEGGKGGRERVRERENKNYYIVYVFTL